MLRAALPMYARRETAPALDRIWGIIRDAIVARGAALAEDLPDALEAPERLDAHWRAPDLILSQACSLPFRTLLRGKVAYVTTLDYGLPGCPPGHYNSVILTRAGGAVEGVLACNSPGSQSGWAAAAEAIAAGRAMARGHVATGAHLASVQAVAEGRADWAAVDAQSWRMIRRWEPVAGEVEERFRTAPTPGLPLICALGQDAVALAGAVEEAVHLLDAQSRELLGLYGACRLPEADYLALPVPEAPPA